MFEILSDIIGALLSLVLSLLGDLLRVSIVPVLVLGIISLALVFILNKQSEKERADEEREINAINAERYKNSNTPVGYRESRDETWAATCHSCPHSKRSYKNDGHLYRVDNYTLERYQMDKTVYCSKYDIDVRADYVCDIRSKKRWPDS